MTSIGFTPCTNCPTEQGQRDILIQISGAAQRVQAPHSLFYCPCCDAVRCPYCTTPDANGVSLLQHFANDGALAAHRQTASHTANAPSIHTLGADLANRLMSWAMDIGKPTGDRPNEPDWRLRLLHLNKVVRQDYFGMVMQQLVVTVTMNMRIRPGQHFTATTPQESNGASSAPGAAIGFYDLCMRASDATQTQFTRRIRYLHIRILNFKLLSTIALAEYITMLNTCVDRYSGMAIQQETVEPTGVPGGPVAKQLPFSTTTRVTDDDDFWQGPTRGIGIRPPSIRYFSLTPIPCSQASVDLFFDGLYVVAQNARRDGVTAIDAIRRRVYEWVMNDEGLMEQYRAARDEIKLQILDRRGFGTFGFERQKRAEDEGKY